MEKQSKGLTALSILMGFNFHHCWSWEHVYF